MNIKDLLTQCPVCRAVVAQGEKIPYHLTPEGHTCGAVGMTWGEARKVENRKQRLARIRASVPEVITPNEYRLYLENLDRDW